MFSMVFPQVAMGAGLPMWATINPGGCSDETDDPASRPSPTTVPPNGDVIAVTASGARTKIPAWIPADISTSGLGQTEHQPGLVLLVIEAANDVPTEFIHALSTPEDSRAVVVCGPANDPRWRVHALAAGATGCLSPDTPHDDQRSTILIALNYHAERRQALGIRNQSERLCFELASLIGSTSEELLAAKDTARRVHSALEDLRNRIVRIFI